MVDPLGLLTEVIIWQPVGHGRSSFGHVSVNINGVSYSFAPHGMDIRDFEEYIDMNSFREGVGSELSLDPCEEEYIEDYLSYYSDPYSRLTNNCIDPILDALENLGYDLGTNIFPVSLGESLMDSGLVEQYNFYNIK